MNNRNYPLGALVIAFMSLLIANAAVSGEVRCVQQTIDDKCKLTWDFSTTPKAMYRIERLDPLSGKWNDVSTVELLTSGSTAVDGGSLYHVRGCNIGSKGAVADCAASNVVWVPVFPEEKDVPSEVVGIHGETMSISKDADLAMQTEQYNVYLLVRLLDMVDLASLPPMLEVTAQDILADGKWTLSEGMQRSFYLNFTAKQQQAISRLYSSGSTTD